MELIKAVALVKNELASATERYGKMLSEHEGYAIILEEVRELEREVFAKQVNYSSERLQKEARQVAAMAIRFLVDLC